MNDMRKLLDLIDGMVNVDVDSAMKMDEGYGVHIGINETFDVMGVESGFIYEECEDQITAEKKARLLNSRLMEIKEDTAESEKDGNIYVEDTSKSEESFAIVDVPSEKFDEIYDYLQNELFEGAEYKTTSLHSYKPVTFQEEGAMQITWDKFKELYQIKGKRNE